MFKSSKWLYRYFLLSVLIFAGVEISKYFQLNAPSWVYHHLNDFSTIPIVATIALIVVRIVKKDDGIKLNALTVFSLVVGYSIYFEYYLPKTSSCYTGDMVDVLCYLAGGIAFMILQDGKAFFVPKLNLDDRNKPI